MSVIEALFTAFANFMWGLPLVVLLVGGGCYLLVLSKARPYRYLTHAVAVITGRYDDANDEGQVPHYQALATALSGTLGLGNIAGVAVAISLGGPGAIFWMWVTAVVGVATKFYTGTLSVMYRGKDSQGELQGGPMYVIQEGLGPRWKPLALLFAVAGLVGTLPIFQANQLVQIVRDTVAIPNGWVDSANTLWFDAGLGVVLAVLVLAVVLGNIRRIGRVAGVLVPVMVLLYMLMTVALLSLHLDHIPTALTLIVSDAFTGQSVAGGAVGAVILMGIRRGAFSNEAGIGTEMMAHGAAKTKEPVREGLVAMLGPIIDTLVVCTCTALVILVTGVWQGNAEGATLTASAFDLVWPSIGGYAVTVIAVLLSFSTIVTFWYYGAKCLGFLIGAQHQHHYVWWYAAMIVLGACTSLQAVIGLLDGMYAMMAIPTMVATLVLAPKVNQAANDYFSRLRDSR